MNHEEVEGRLLAMVEITLLRNPHFVRQSSRFVLAEGLKFRFKVCEYMPLVGR